MKRMKHFSILLGACLFFWTGLSLKAAGKASASSDLEAHRAYLMNLEHKFLQGSAHSLYGMIDRLQEAYVAHDNGAERVASQLPVEHALRLRENILKTLWGSLSSELQREIRTHVKVVFSGEFTLHKKLLAILSISSEELPVGSSSSDTEDYFADNEEPSGADAPLLRRRTSISPTRERSAAAPTRLRSACQKTTLAREENYPFPGGTVRFEVLLTLDALQTLLNSWYDVASLPNHFEKSSLGRAFATTKEWWTRKQDNGRFLRRKLYILAGKLDALGLVDRGASFFSSSIQALTKKEKAGRDDFLLFLLGRVNDGSIQVENPPAFNQLVEEFKAYRHISPILPLLEGETRSQSVVRNTKGIKLHHMELNEDIREKLLGEFLLLSLKRKEQKAFSNILSYSNDLDREGIRTPCQSGLSRVFCCSKHPKPWKKARRNLRFLVKKANEGSEEKIDDLKKLLFIYEASGVKAALETLQWGFCKDSHRFGSDVEKVDLFLSNDALKNLIR